MPTYVVTGCSGGLGLGLVKALAARGDKVYATCRKKESSATGIDAISSVEGDVTIIEGIDVTKDSVGDALKTALAGVTIDVLVHNAGGLNGTRELTGMAAMADQKLAAVTPARMVEAFELNAVGPLRVQQALMPQMAAPGGKIAVISSGMGSIGDNGSGGIYAYRTSKSAVNSIFKGISCDVKEQGIAVTCVNPGMVATDFGPGAAAMQSMGGMTIEESVAGLVKCLDDLSIETTGKFMTVSSGGKPCDPKEFPGGW